uniref:Uncharacterized protein n=1 Tax=viral metagenome TaxID=1070528 RepID=A0A6C0EMQ8_9ZZZZ
MNDETSLLTFKTICNFVNDLSSEFGKKHRPLARYQRLINQTQISHDKVIRKHIAACNTFCVANREGIMEQDTSKFTENKIIYSERVFIDMAKIFKLADKDTTKVIWDHILTISALVDPIGKAKEVLRRKAEENKTAGPEMDFLANIFSKVEGTVKPDANPMEAISSIMQSGIFTDLLSGGLGGMSSGQMDLGKLIGTVQTMVSGLGEQAGDDPEAKQAMGLLNNLTGMFGNMNTGQSEAKKQVEDVSENQSVD